MKQEKHSPLKPADQYYETYNQLANQARYPVLLPVSIMLFIFGLVCFVWSIPFPHLQFLGKYNGFVNWASFLIAIAIYYYLRLLPSASYLLLFILFAYSYIIIEFEKWQQHGGPFLWIVGLLILLCATGLYRASFGQNVSAVKLFTWHNTIYFPFWLLMKILKRLKLYGG